MKKIFALTTTILMILGIFCSCKPGMQDKGSSQINSTDISSTNSEKPQSEPGIDIYGTFNQNDLIITSTDHMYNSIYIELDQIDGLKNNTVQSKINDAIKKEAEAFLDRRETTENAESVLVEASIGFANILPVTFTAKNLNNSYDAFHLTYNLNNGELVKLEDVFTKDADIQAIVKDAFYAQILQNSYYDFEFEESDSDGYLEQTDNEELYKTVKGYMSSDRKDFEIRTNRIYFYYNELTAWVDFIDVIDEIAIYDRFKTDKSLFVNDNIGIKNLVNCADDDLDMWLNIEYGYLHDNLWYDITMHENMLFETISDSFVKNIRDEQYKSLDEYIKTAKENPDKFYAVLQRSYLNKSNKGTLTLSTKTTLVKMPMTVFESSYKEAMFAAYRANPLTPGVDYTVDCGAIIDHASIKGVTFNEETIEKEFEDLTAIVLETEE